MGSPYHNLDSRLEAALSEVITDAISGGSLTLTNHGVIRTGIDYQPRDANCIVCHVSNADEYVERSGMWRATCSVNVYTNIDATNATTAHKGNIARIRDLFMDSDIAATLTATDESILATAAVNYSISNDVEDRFAVGGLTFDVIVSPQ